MLNIPATAELSDRYLANFEFILNQNSPLADKAFLRVLSSNEAMNHTELYKLAIERALQNLALTATGDDLKAIGQNYGVVFKEAEAAVLEIIVNGTDATVILQGIIYVGDSNGLKYIVNSDGTISGGNVTLEITAQETGAVGNLSDGSVLSISTPVPGADSFGTVTGTINTGADEESEEDYRVRVLDEIRTQGGGGNSADYRRWAQEVAGVVRAYPYAGRPISDPTPSEPPERTVYVEVDTAIDPDGIAPAAILDEVRDTITTDPETGKTRQPLGLTDDTLYVESITRTALIVIISTLIVPTGTEAQVKSDIDSAVETYFRSLRPYVEGLDVVAERNDSITELTLSEVIQNVVGAAGGSAEAVFFGLTSSSLTSLYTLVHGETVKSGGVTYV